MAFCKFSSEIVIDNSTRVDNLFIDHYLPHAPESCVKVYLYGLYHCGHSDSADNTLEKFSKILGLCEQDILDIFKYWQEEGLIQILNTSPIEIRYIPVKNALNSIKKYDPKKYSAFNEQAQQIIQGRMISEHEYGEYYDNMQVFHIQPEALLMVMQYCINLKGADVGYSYILTVAKNWAMQGITTSETVENKLKEFENNMGEIKEVLNALKLKRPANFDEMQMFIKWNKEMSFTLGAILCAAKKLKGKGGFERLDSKMLKYYENKKFSALEIENYESEKNNLFNLAREINKLIGVYYENVEAIVDNYITDWTQKGYSPDTLKQIASYCFKSNIRTLDGMNNAILKFYKLGITTIEMLNDYTSGVLATDNLIKEILSTSGIERMVTSFDRDYYRTWTNSWHFNYDLIVYSATLANGKREPLAYMNKILSTWLNNKVDTIEKAKSQGAPQITAEYANKSKVTERSYSTEELKTLFDNIDEVDV
ncbi:MAG: DnaD domain protein [Clostridia bacterium]|jgi:DnaD/phage-associated family protein|nr:DnaD domain protein [Clostridia bacterium]